MGYSKSKPEQSRDLLREAGLKPVQVWIHKDDTKTHEKIMKHDKRAEVRKARQK